MSVVDVIRKSDHKRCCQPVQSLKLPEDLYSESAANDFELYVFCGLLMNTAYLNRRLKLSKNWRI